MDHSKTFYTADRAEWRKWLLEHYQTEKEVWFVFPTKDSKDPSLSYNDAVEEALCFGWIDSTTGKLDNTHGIRRFCPRREGSSYSRPNVERLLWLDKRGLIMPEIREKVKDVIYAPYAFPEYIMAHIRESVEVFEHFQAFSEPYKRIRIAYIEAAHDRPEEYEKRLASFLQKTRENKLIIGFGGIDKYYGEGKENRDD